MKRNIYILFSLFFIIACSDNDEKVIPSDVLNISAEQKEGSIVLKWDIPSDSCFHYMKVKYYDHWEKMDKTILTSVYSDNLLIENMLQKFGVYTFILQTVSHTGDLGKVQTIEASCLRRPVDLSVTDSHDIPLDASMLSTNSQELIEGPIANLVDNNASTYFHTIWSSSVVWPAYIQVDLNEPVDAFYFWYKNRANSNGKPSVIEVYGSTNKNDGFELITTINSGLPSASAAEYTSSYIITNPRFYSSIRLLITETAANNTFFNMAELKFYKCDLAIYDPENDND